MKLYYVLAYFLTITTLSYPQSGWVKQESGTAQNLNSVYFNDIDNGFVVGNNGTILKTTDGGTNWIKQTVGITNNLNYVSFIDTLHGTIVGNGGTILRTDDGGISWKNQTSGVTVNLYGVSFYDINNGVAVGGSYDSSAVLQTKDGGLTWEVLSRGEVYLPLRVNYIDSNNIAVMSNGPSTRVYYSSDTGKSWNIQWLHDSGGSGGLQDVSFVDSKLGFLIGTSGMTSQYYSYIYKTTDGGRSWQNITKTSLPSMFSIYFVNANVGFTIGLDQGYLGAAVGGSIFKTTNGGITWNQQFTNSSYQFKSVYFSNTEVGTIVGKGGLILRTTTGGVLQETSTWKVINSGVTTDLKRVIFSNENKGFCIGDEMLKTTDNGISWQNPNYYFYPFANDRDIWFADSLNGIISSYVSIYSTSDGGGNWQETKFNDHLFGACCIDNLHRIVIGWGGTIHYTSDGGQVWSYINSGTYSHLKDIFFINHELGFIVGDGGVILRSTDGGLTWNSLISNTPNSLDGVFFLNNEVGIVVGTSGTILRTTDSGNTWKLQDSRTFSDLYSVFLRDKKDGLIVGDLGVILRTTDGGINWTNEQSGINSTLYGVTIKDSVEIAVGGGGTILRNITSFTDSVINQPNPTSFSLSQNYPNPFNPSTTIEYTIPEQSHVTIKIYDLLGREIATLVNKEKDPGNYNVVLNGKNLSSGIYFYQLKTNNFVQTKKMILLK